MFGSMSVAASHIKIGEEAGPIVLEEVCSARDIRKYPAAAAHLSAHGVAIGTNFVLMTESKCHFARHASLANSEAGSAQDASSRGIVLSAKSYICSHELVLQFVLLVVG